MSIEFVGFGATYILANRKRATCMLAVYTENASSVAFCFRCPKTQTSAVLIAVPEDQSSLYNKTKGRVATKQFQKTGRACGGHTDTRKA